VLPSPNDLTPEDVAARFPANRRPDITTVHEWLRRGTLRGYKAGPHGRYWYVTPQALDEFCAQRPEGEAEEADDQPKTRRRKISQAAKKTATDEARRLCGVKV
jgi:hypothetical protein